MSKIRFKHILIFFILFFVALTYVFYHKTQETALVNTQNKINELLLNYKAVRSNVGELQKEEVYRLQALGIIDKEYFNPVLLSSTFNAKVVNNFYNRYKEMNGKRAIEIRFASDNPRNPTNKANKKESSILEKFNSGELTEYSKIIDENGAKSLYYVVPTKKTTNKCMRCHSDPKLAPKGLVDIYGDKNGFYEKEGNIRAILSTTYPMDDDLEAANKTFFILTAISFIIFSALLTMIYIFKRKLEEANKTLDDKVNQRTKELDNEKKHLKTIIDINPSLIIVTNGKKLISANQQFLEFFKIKNIDEFFKDSYCICEYFEEFNNNKFDLETHKVEGELWCEYLNNNRDKIHHVTLNYNDKLSYFIISGIEFNDNNDILVTLQNITEQKEKDLLLFEQSKLASMGEMIGNIAHQWRQPLSVISSSSTGMAVHKEYNILTDEEFYKACELIDKNAQYLSRTIDDFRDFIKGDRTKVQFNLNEHIDSFLHLVEGTKKSNNIEVILDTDKNIILNSYPNELTQCFINIFNNAKDIYNEKNIEVRYYFITTKIEKDNVVIILKDNGGGIPAEVLPNIFNPYFTTKHESQGTGLGLHMTYNIINNGHGGTIHAQNTKYTYKGTDYQGAEFVITLPIG